MDKTSQIYDLKGRMISTPDHWEILYEAWSGHSDEELEKRGKSPNGAIYTEMYVAGDYPKWNKSGERSEGDVYEGVCREFTILEMRHARRAKAQAMNDESMDNLVQNQ